MLTDTTIRKIKPSETNYPKPDDPDAFGANRNNTELTD